MIYSYTTPEPAGLAAAPIGPDAAFYSDPFKEFFLPYEQVRRASDPAQMILAFAQTTYDAVKNTKSSGTMKSSTTSSGSTTSNDQSGSGTSPMPGNRPTSPATK